MKPIIVDLYLTYHCNLQCEHCCHNAGPFRNDHMTMGQIDFVNKWMTNLKNKGINITALGFTGGEPTLHPQFEKIVKTLASHRRTTRFGLFTNGTQDLGMQYKRIFSPITVAVDVFHKKQVDVASKANDYTMISPLVTFVSADIFRDKGRCKERSKSMKFVRRLCTHQQMTNQGNIIRICFDPNTIRFCLENSLYKDQCPINFVDYKQEFLDDPEELVKLGDEFTRNHSGDKCTVPCSYYKEVK